MRRPVVVALIVGSLLLACSEQPTEVPNRPEPPAAGPQVDVGSAPCTLDTLINRAAKLFPPSPQLTAIVLALKALPQRPQERISAIIRRAVFGIIDIFVKAYNAGKLAGGKSAATQANLLAFINGLYCFVGLPQPNIPLGALDPSDGAIAVIMPNSPQTLVQPPSKHSGLSFPAASVPVPVTITISRLPDLPGPLRTSLNQFPLFFEFTSSPDVTFTKDVTAGVCVVNDLPTGGSLRLAHNVSPFGFGDVEILPPATAPVVCGDLPVIGSAQGSSGFMAGPLRSLARAILPTELHATSIALITTGVGGTLKHVSPFGTVDTASNPGSLKKNPNDATFDGLQAPPGGSVTPPSVKVTSKNGRTINKVPVVFAVTAGGGSINGGTTATVNTDANGIASLSSWVLGSSPGANTVTATPTHVDQVGTATPYKPEAAFDPAFLTFTATAAGPPFGFENGEQEFTGTGFWNRNTFAGLFNGASPTYVTTVGNGFPAPPQGSYAAWFGRPSAGPFTTGNYIGTQSPADTPLSGGTSTLPDTGTFISPPFTVPDVLGPVSLRFKTWWEIESVNPSRFDIMRIELMDAAPPNAVSVLDSLNPATDPIGGAPALPFTSDGFNVAPVWEDVAFDISLFKGQTVQLRFNFNTHDHLYNGFRGWIVDDVRVVAGSFFLAPKLSAEQAAVGKLAPADQGTLPVRTRH